LARQVRLTDAITVSATTGEGLGALRSILTPGGTAVLGGARLIDTPGIREVGLWDSADGAFADIEAAAVNCRFTDCAHDAEPGCAVRDAVDGERISAWRKLARQQAWIQDRKAAGRAQREFGRKLAR
jgi:ribosome biogenesis GTPase